MLTMIIAMIILRDKDWCNLRGGYWGNELFVLD